MTKEAKRIGRPLKAPQRGKKVALGLKVTADIKRRLDSAARASGRTQSQEAEHRIELSYQYERALGEVEQAKKRLMESLAEITQGNTKAELRRLGWTVSHDIRGEIFRPPGRGRGPQSEWLEPDKEPSPQIDPDAETFKALVNAVKAALDKEGRK